MSNQSNNSGNRNFQRNRRSREPEHKINDFILHSRVRITGEGIESKVCDLQEAKDIASELGLDLVEINSTGIPPVCKIVNYQKFLYEKKKKEKEVRNANKSTTKEVKLGPQISDNDLDHKIKSSIKFLKEGNKVRAYVQFKARQIAFKEQGEIVLLKFIQALQDVGKPEFLPKMEGRSMFVIISPKAH